MNDVQWRCVLVGGESLLIECARALARHGHAVVAIVSKAAPLRRWAAEQGCRVLADAQELLAAGDLGPIDMLFSVTHLEVLPPEVITLPTRAAINFHDGPLPAYAGLNTPVWALLNGEAEHGVTWHLMTREVDRGDILVERRIPIVDGETALTLNAKCFEAGIDSFDELVRGLGAGTLSARPQATPPQHHYRRRDRPDAAATIDWARDAQSLSRLVRALDFGAYANPVGAAKMLVEGGSPLLVGALQVTQARSGLPPGSIVAIDTAALRVATADFDIEVGALHSDDGRAVAVAEAVRRYGLHAGAMLPLLDAVAAGRLTDFARTVAGHEGFWRQRLETQDAIELPQVDRSLAASRAAPANDMALPPALAAATPTWRLVSVLAWLGRVADKAQFDIGWLSPGRVPVELPVNLFAAQVPLRATLDFEQGLAAQESSLQAECNELQRRGTYLADLVARTPELRARVTQRDPRRLPVTVQVVERLEEARAPEGSELSIALTADGSAARWFHDSSRLGAAQVAAMQRQWLSLAAAGLAEPQRPLGELPLMDEALRERVLHGWNRTDAPVPAAACVHHLIEAQAAATPHQPALIGGVRSLSYAELDRRADHLAARLGAMGVGPDTLVGLCLPRGVDLVVALLAIHKAGGAYVPLDPAYPAERIAYMLQDSKAAVLVTDHEHAAGLDVASVRRLLVDDAAELPAEVPRHDGGARPEHLAYVIYTSGSTGRPKGVMVEHRNVVNFFAGMDRHLAADGPGTWLAVTSLSFDISVLELLWTLARGYTAVIASEEDRLAVAAGPAPAPAPRKPIDFSLFYFSADEAEQGRDKYRLLLEGAKFGDRHGFAAVWTPERHFHAFGGLYPNPAVAGAAIAAVTERIGIRAGSVVLPLHHPARVAEEWSVVDNLSNGRVGISFASGWQPNDFVLKPENFADNKGVMLKGIETVRRLWRGEAVEFDGPLGKPVATRTLPRPVQAELPYWVTSAGNPQTFADAGRIGARVLTHLLGQTVEELAEKIAVYRKAYREAGHAGEGYVSLMLHSFVGDDLEQVRATVKQPLIEYLRTSLNLVKQYAWSFPAFKNRDAMGGVDLSSLAKDEMDALLEYSFERYFEGSGLFGTPESCLAMVDRIRAVGVDDVACLIDFGVASDAVLEHLPQLARLRELSQPRAELVHGSSLAELMQRHRVTHLQCTPSLARMLAQDPASRAGLAQLRRMMVGGEAFPPSLARELAALVRGPVMNMYGPTETTVWSAVHTVDRDASGVIPLGRPLAHQQVYILDARGQPLPPGVPGELVIGGAGVVRGYFERPELTAERFVPDTVGGSGGRLYRTGDLARWHEAPGGDGVLEFLGRLDHQVKVRGHRIELGEIEAALTEQPGVAQAVVMAREDAPGDVRLVAYLLARHGATLEAGTMRAALRARLPEFMLPAHFVTLAEFPHTPNGKIDRKALPAPDAQAAPSAAAPAADYAAPEGELEARIAAVWMDVLKLPRVGTRDNFFDLGGHSLLAVQAHRRLRESLQREISITDIFRFPTVAGLAAFLAGDVEDAAQQAAERAQGRRAAMQRRAQLRGGVRA